MPEKNLVIVNNLPWRRNDPPPRANRLRDEETWMLDIDGLHVWVKHYVTGFDNWKGWRIGRGGSPLLSLNDGDPFPDRESALHAAYRVAVVTATEGMDRATQALTDAQRAVKEVVLPI